MASSTPTPTTPEQLDEERDRVLVVESDGQLCAMPIEQVLEVVRPRAITPVPGAPAISRGLVNVRGMVVTVLDLGVALRLGDEDSAGSVTNGAQVHPPVGGVVPSSIVLLEHGGRAVGVAVDAVHDVRLLDAGETSSGVKAPSESGVADSTGSDTVPRIRRGIASAGDDIVIRLDLSALLTRVMLSPEEGP